MVCNGIVEIEVFPQTGIDTAEEIPQRRVSRCNYMGLFLTFRTAVIVRDGELVNKIQVVEDVG